MPNPSKGDYAAMDTEMSLRTFLAELEKNNPTEFLRIREPVALDYEISALTMEMDRRKRSPVLLFDNVKGSSFPILANMFGSRRNFAAALGIGEDVLIEKLARGSDRVIEPILAKTGPVQEVVH